MGFGVDSPRLYTFVAVLRPLVDMDVMFGLCLKPRQRDVCLRRVILVGVKDVPKKNKQSSRYYI